MELKGYLKKIIEQEKWTEISAHVSAAKLMNIEVGQKYPVFLNGQLKTLEIVNINGEKVTFKSLRETE